MTERDPSEALSGRAAVEAQLGRVAALVRHILGDALLGLYLHGSAVAGGLRPDSDLDLLAVVGRSLTSDERQALIKGLLPISGRGDASGHARPVELTVVRNDALRPWLYPPPVELQYGDWWRREFEMGAEPWATPNPDLAIAIAAARQADHPLFGPPAAELLDPIPAEDLVRSSLAGIDDLLASLETDTRNVLLTLARIWLTVSTGGLVGKEEAARWAAERLPPEEADVVRAAGVAHLTGAQEDWEERLADARRCAEVLVGRIRAAR